MKLILTAAAAAATLSFGTPVFAQYDYTRSTDPTDLAAVPADTRADTLAHRADWLESRLRQDRDSSYIDRSDYNSALDRLQTIRDEQRRLERDDGSITVADAQTIQDRLNRLEDRVREADPHSRNW